MGSWVRARAKSFNLEPLMRARGPRTPFKRNCVTNGTKIILLSGWFRWKKLPWMSYRLKKTYPFSHYPLHTRTHSPDFGWIQTCPESARLSICHRTHTCPEVSTWGVESSVQASLGHCLMTGNSHNSWPLILLIVFFSKNLSYGSPCCHITITTDLSNLI